MSCGLDLEVLRRDPVKEARESGVSAVLPLELTCPETPVFSVSRELNPVQDGLIKMAKGTTTLAFLFQGGVCVAVDSRSTMGQYIASQSVRKVIPIAPHIIGTMAGGAADCSFWERNLRRQCRLHELRNKEPISVAAASKLFQNTIYSYKNSGLSIGAMIAGWDKTGPQLYYVDSDANRMKYHRFSVGSGSPYAYGVLDAGYRFDLTEEEAQDLGRRAIYHATHRDAFSGGVVNVFLVTAKGWEQKGQYDVTELHYQYAAEKAAKA
eukprot:gnl/Hemi2/16394_TR5467_c0_g1_i1.p1 gnl/Hemi2/16394_TR5467_c0_g1~~gnl/Hemi2/16394_TR5467_c0_g1_i1.p1  ORF type:complete len:266 (-),score=84.78 gnl/Hemi2/16394_TR5467_c0_g1_i1:101-898(-)